MSYSSLHNHDYHSYKDGYGSPKEMMDRAKEVGLKAIAITNHASVGSLIYYDDISKNYPDIKIIFGCELYENPYNDPTIQDKDNKYYHLICLARNEQGRKDLNRIITRSDFEDFYSKPRTCLDWFNKYDTSNFVMTSACLAGKLARTEDMEKCIKYISEYKKLFPYFYLEMQSHKHIDQEVYNKKILELSKLTNTPFIITTDSHYAKESDAKYQSYLVSIGRNSTNYDKETIENNEIYEDCYIQSEEEIHRIMDSQIGYENVCIGLKNTNEIADLCEQGHMPFGKPELPKYDIPKEFDNDFEYLKYLCEIGWKDRRIDKKTDEEQKVYRERLEYELSVINQMGFNSYFIIVWDFLNWCRNNHVAIGKGRGSASGCLVCYFTHITDIDPIKYNLIFERFLNPERISMPDVDSDVANREKVINYLSEKYGKERVCQVINFVTITPTVAITSVGKVLGYNYNEMKKIGQKFTQPTWEECVKADPSLLNDYPQYAELFDISNHLCGRVSGVSIHAGAVGIVNTTCEDFCALRRDTKGNRVLCVDKHFLEEITIIKYDILLVSTLDIVQDVKDELGLDDYELDIENSVFESDKETYDLLATGKLLGVFQCDSQPMRELFVRLKPKSIEEISGILALYRPDSMGELEDYVRIALSGEEPTYIHPDMKPILQNSFGKLIYQEQTMEISRVFGGRTYGGADRLRKCLAKKIKEDVKKESELLRKEIVDNGYSKEIADTIADFLSKCGSYSFNKSHSVSYAVLCFETAYLKIHYPVYFYKALLNQNKDKAGNINKYILDAKDFNVQVLPPNVNHSEMNFSVSNDKIIFGLSAITGIGESVAQQIIDERNTNGLFKSFEDFKERTNLKKSQIIALIKAGAIPCKNKMVFLKKYLESLYEPLVFSEVASIPTYNKLIVDWGIDVSKYELETTGKRKSYDKDALLVEYNRLKKIKFDEEQKVRFSKFIEENKKYIEDEEFWEFQTLQIFINNNPFESAFDLMSQTFDEVEVGDECVIVGIISKVQKKKDKNGKQFAYANIYSTFGLVEALVWHSQLKEYEDLVKKGEKVAILCRKDSDTNVTTKKMKSYEQWLEDMVKIKKN